MERTERLLARLTPAQWAEIDRMVDEAEEDRRIMAETGVCPHAPHRGPEGPNEDLAQCPVCRYPTWALRPEGEEFGGHIADCSLPRRHPGYCQPGGNGHPAPRVLRG